MDALTRYFNVSTADCHEMHLMMLRAQGLPEAEKEKDRENIRALLSIKIT